MNLIHGDSESNLKSTEKWMWKGLLNSHLADINHCYSHAPIYAPMLTSSNVKDLLLPPFFILFNLFLVLMIAQTVWSERP